MDGWPYEAGLVLAGLCLLLSQLLEQEYVVFGGGALLWSVAGHRVCWFCFVLGNTD